MIFAIFATIVAGATAKLLNKIGVHRTSVYAIILTSNVIGAAVSAAFVFLNPHVSLTIPKHYYVSIGIPMLLWPIASILTYYGMRHTQVSVRESLTQSRLIFVPLIAVLFLGENIIPFAGLGTILIFVGILTAVYKSSLSIKHSDMHGVGYVLAASFIIAIISTFDKHNVSGTDYMYYSLLVYVGQSVIFLLFLNKERGRELLALLCGRNTLVVTSAGLSGAFFYILQLWLYTHLALHIAYPIIQLSSAAALVLAIIFLGEHDRIPFKILGFSLAALGAVLLRLAM